jgi:cell division transport system permease protein
MTLPLQRDPANRFLPWIVALMVYLAVLALAGVLVLDTAVQRWRSGRSDTLTVQVPPDGESVTEARVNATLKVLHDTPGIATARALDRNEIAALLEPWLGKGNISTDLPLPRLIDVVIAPGTEIDLGALEARVQAVAPGAEVDDHKLWLDRLAATARSLQVAALAVVLSIIAAACSIVVFTTRTSLTVHNDAIEVLHLIGARDAFVARVFASQALLLGLRGGLLGFVPAVITLTLIRHFAGEIDAPLLPQFALSPVEVGALAALPLVSALIAMLTARITVMRSLARMP